MFELAIVLRNILLVQLLLILGTVHAVPVRSELLKIWKRLNASSGPEKKRGRKRHKFREIDLTRFEP